MKYLIRKIASCNGAGVAAVGSIGCWTYSNVNDAFKNLNKFNNQTALEKHGGERKPCECAYEIIDG